MSVANSGRTPLFAALRRAMRLALAADRTGMPVDELVEIARERVTRRDALRTAAGGALAAGGLAGALARFADAAPAAPGLARAATSGVPNIAIVGAGMAGLAAAYTLRKAGVRAKIYEASPRAGGRVRSAKDLLAPGLVTEVGAEFIDTNHETMLAYVKEFQLPLIDRTAAGERRLKTAYWFNGRHYSEREVVDAFRPVAARILRDQKRIPDTFDYQNRGGLEALDRISLAEYLPRVGATGWLRELLDVAFVTEYGLDAGEQSSLNLVSLIGADLSSGFSIFGESDERFKVLGGNQRVPDELARRLDGQIEYEKRLVAIRSIERGVALTFDTGGATTTVGVDFAIVTLPFTVLRDVEIRHELPPVKRKAIDEMGYGTNTKLMLGTKSRPWRRAGYTGETFSDEPFQLAWDNSQGQPGTSGGVTMFSGGKAGVDVGEGTGDAQTQRLLPGLEKVYPGLTAEMNGRVSRFHWPSFRWSKGSYGCYKPGQWTTIRGAEGAPVNRLYFAGEHCSLDFQGYMNGAAETGQAAARGILRRVRR